MHWLASHCSVLTPTSENIFLLQFLSHITFSTTPDIIFMLLMLFSQWSCDFPKKINGSRAGTVTMFAPGLHKLSKIYQKRKEKKKKKREISGFCPTIYTLYWSRGIYILHFYLMTMPWLLSAWWFHWKAQLGCQLSLPLQPWSSLPGI